MSERDRLEQDSDRREASGAAPDERSETFQALTRRISALSPRQRELLERRMRRAGLMPEATPGVVRVPDAPHHPLSSGQQRLWLIDWLVPGCSAYNIPFAGRLVGRLDPEVLDRAVQEMVRRHEVLRTTYALVDGAPAQCVWPSVRIALPIDDLSSLPDAEREAEVARRVSEEARLPFDLQRGPVLRVKLLRLGPEEHELMVTLPHIATDAWSMAIIFREIPALYEAFARGAPSPLPELPIQFRDWAAWQRGTLRDDRLEPLLEFWKHELEGAPTRLELVTDRPRPPAHAFRGRRHPFGIPPDLQRELREASRREGVTLFMLLLAAFGLLLRRLSGQDDVLIGSPVVTREPPEAEALIGFFINTAVFRIDMRGDPTARELLRRVRDRSLGAFAHQDLPFDRLVEALGIERDPSRQPLVQATLVLQNVHIPPPLFEGLRLTRFQQTDTRTSRVDLVLAFWEAGDELNGGFEYDTDLFEAATVARMEHQLLVTLRELAARPGARVSALHRMDAVERRELLETWNDTQRPLRGALTVHERFRARAVATPEAIAVADEHESLTYSELARRASRLAARLRAAGIGPESRVGVALERSPRFVVAALGVLEAGGCFVALDPSYPAERLAFMVRDSGARLVVSDRASRNRIPGSPDVLAIDEEANEPVAARPALEVDPANLAYVVYTSGSTGTPKGVMVTHQGAVNFGAEAARLWGAGPGDGVLQFAPASFDAAIGELLLALEAGATLHIPPPGARLPGPELVEFLQRSGVTHAILPPSALAVLPMTELPRLRVLVAAAETCPPEVAARWKQPGRRVVNGYGPTEGTVGSTLHDCEDDEGRLPIGRPIGNVRCHVLDDRLELLPVAAPGELCLAGAGLARGYLGRPGLTADRFRPDPFATDPGARLYRTGDRVRRRADGVLEFLGRLDDQLKVRGFRIEPGEIEAALHEHPGVGQAAVTAREDDAGTRRLVAYVTGRGGAPAPAAAALRAHLGERLPDHLVPTRFVMLERLPTTPGGKVDRCALPAPQEAAAPEPAAHVAPRTAIETHLAAIWRDVLGVDEVGIHDHFFERGGDSILSLQVVARAREAGIPLPPAAVFEHPTIAALAELAGASEPAAAPEVDEHGGETPLTAVQRWFFDLTGERPAHWNMAVWLEVRDGIAPQVVRRALESVVARHGALRSSFVRSGGEWRQRTHAPDETAAPALDEIVVDDSGGAELAARLEAHERRLHEGFDLARAPLLRGAWFDLGQDRPARLLLVAHHLVMDAVSWRIVLEDLDRSCRALTQGDVPAEPHRTTPFRSWAERITAAAITPAFEREVAFWRATLAAAGAAIPRDHDGDGLESAAVTRTRRLEPDETRDLIEHARRAYRMTVEEMTLAALGGVLARWTGAARVWVDVESHGRETARFPGCDLSRTVGWFTSWAPVSFTLDARDAGARLMAVKEARRATPDRGLGWSVLRWLHSGEAARPLREARTPEVSFDYLGTLDLMRDPGAAFRPIPAGGGSARAPHLRRPHPIAVEAFVLGGALELRLTGGTDIHHAATLERLADGLRDELRALARHCQSPGAGAYTPSDFPEAGLDGTQLDRFLARLHRVEVAKDE